MLVGIGAVAVCTSEVVRDVNKLSGTVVVKLCWELSVVPVVDVPLFVCVVIAVVDEGVAVMPGVALVDDGLAKTYTVLVDVLDQVGVN